MSTIIPDVLLYDILTHLKGVLDANKSELDAIITKYESKEALNKVWIGDWEVLGDYPCITLEPLGVSQKWGATSKTLENTYSVRITCYVKNLNKEVSVKFILDFAEAVRRVLTHPDNLAWTLPERGAVVYDSFISAASYGTLTRKGFSLRAAQLDYTCLSWNSRVDRV